MFERARNSKLNDEIVEFEHKYYEILPLVPRKEFLKALSLDRLLGIARELNIPDRHEYDKAMLIVSILDVEQEIRDI
jgi:hypothetical protein